MSRREGTRRKKISVLHMLGTWEGKIDGCNCPSCKDYDKEQAAALIKSPSKVGKGAKVSPKKTVIKVKTTKVIVDVETGDVIGRTSSPSKKQTVIDNELKGSSISLENDQCAVVSRVSDIENLSKTNNDDKQNLGISDINDQEISTEGGFGKALVLPVQKHEKSASIDETFSDRIQIKQEPDEFFSDEDDFESDSLELSRDITHSDSRARKRARMVTSEAENIYAKPRMLFTGKGVVRKIEPAVDKVPKSKRGRKPSKMQSVAKVKQEKREETEDDDKLNRLQTALSEVAHSLCDDGDIFDVINPFEDEPKDTKVRKKSKLKMVKRVDSEGDKYIECNMCFKLLKESSMKQHYKTHTGEKPHPCDECKARFTRKGDVERHKRLVHKNQKPFKCRKCKRCFPDLKALKVHLQNHDKASYYACNTCGFKFGKREYYENHIRYIHPLPEGAIEPNFGDMDFDIAMQQLEELEREEQDANVDPHAFVSVKTEVETLIQEDANQEKNTEEVGEQEKEKDTAEITVTEGSEERPKVVNSETNNNSKDEQILCPTLPKSEAEEDANNFVPESKSHIGTDIRVCKGTLSFTQTVSDTGTQDEDLVNKAIADAVSQATNAIESLQNIAGANMSGNDVDIDDDEEEEEDDDEEDEAMMESDEFPEILNSREYDIVPMEQKPLEQPPPEIHISASVGGQKKKFIIQVPVGSQLNMQTPEGMEMIVNMVNQLCGGKGELDGPLEVVLEPGTRGMNFD